MKYVIIRDDDTNATTPIECLETLYRPFLDRNLPINLAVIPNVNTQAKQVNGSKEGFLLNCDSSVRGYLPISHEQSIVKYLKDNNYYKIIQHGYTHDYNEFDIEDRKEVIYKIKQGKELFSKAGFAQPNTFVAPYDKISRVSYQEIIKHFHIISTGYFEMKRLPLNWFPKYFLKKFLKKPHWKVAHTILLSHPGCLLSYTRSYDNMFANVKRTVESGEITVLVTHWWEYFRNQVPDQSFIKILHSLADYLASNREIQVIGFEDLLKIPLIT